MQQIVDPRRRQARVEGEDRGTAAIQRRRQRVEQAAGSGGGWEQERVQGTSGHQRKVTGKTPVAWEGQQVTEWQRPEIRS